MTAKESNKNKKILIYQELVQIAQQKYCNQVSKLKASSNSASQLAMILRKSHLKQGIDKIIHVHILSPQYQTRISKSS